MGTASPSEHSPAAVRHHSSSCPGHPAHLDPSPVKEGMGFALADEQLEAQGSYVTPPPRYS